MIETQEKIGKSHGRNHREGVSDTSRCLPVTIFTFDGIHGYVLLWIIVSRWGHEFVFVIQVSCDRQIQPSIGRLNAP